MKRKLMILVTIIFTLSYLTAAIHTLQSLERLEVEDLREDNLVEVQQTTEGRANGKINKNYYIIRVGRKDKKDAYFKVKQLFDRVINILIKNKIIPDEDSLVKSKIKPQYQSKKRRWVFSTIFVVIGTNSQLDKTYRDLSRLGVLRLQTKPSINFLNEKLLAMQLFNNAKAELTERLERLDYKIVSVEEIEIYGKQVENTDLIEEQLEEEFNESEDNLEEKDLVESTSLATEGKLDMKILFKVGPKGEETSDQEDDYQDERDEEESQSSDDDQDL